MSLRTFVALEVPPLQKQGIAKYLETWSRLHRNGINWVKPENLHLTLLFIGDTRNADLQDWKKELYALTRRTDSFRMQCLGFELFPSREPRLLWVKLATADKAVFDFAKALQRTARELEYQPDAKPLKLHITAARLKTQQPAWLEQEFMQAELPKELAEFNTVTFYQSILKPDGPVYVPLQQYDLKTQEIKQPLEV